MDGRVTKMRAYFDAAVERVEKTMDLRAAEMRRHFGVTSESLKREIRLTAEGVVLVKEDLNRETASICDDMRRGFAETQAMIKFSHAELDRRTWARISHRALEETVADLLSRDQRLESSMQ